MTTFIIFWQQLPLIINPIAIIMGPLAIHWYSIMYALAFFATYSLLEWRLRYDLPHINKQCMIDSFIFSIPIIVLCSRMVYVIFYNPSYYMLHPIEIVWPFNTAGQFIGIRGLSYHGGLFGVILSVLIFSKIYKIPIKDYILSLAPVIPFGYFFGRIGNFLNLELYGRITTLPIGMEFTANELRHPSQLYEACGEGLLIFIILWTIRNHPKIRNFLGPIYFVLYGSIRFIIEFFREPDEQIGLLLLQLSMGQWLCLLMISIGIIWISMILYQEQKNKRTKY